MEPAIGNFHATDMFISAYLIDRHVLRVSHKPDENLLAKSMPENNF